MSWETITANHLFNDLVGSGILRFPIFCDEGLEKFCRWHLTDLHTTDQCQIFNNFLIKALLLLLESRLLPWDFRIWSFLKEKGSRPCQLTNGMLLKEGMMKSGSESSRANETGMTYKQVLQSPPGMTRLVENLQVLRHRMCESCSNLLHARSSRSRCISGMSNLNWSRETRRKWWSNFHSRSCRRRSHRFGTLSTHHREKFHLLFAPCIHLRKAYFCFSRTSWSINLERFISEWEKEPSNRKGTRRHRGLFLPFPSTIDGSALLYRLPAAFDWSVEV